MSRSLFLSLFGGMKSFAGKGGLTKACQSARSIEHLRDLKAFFGTTFKIKDASSAPSASSRLALTDGADEDELVGKGGKVEGEEEYILSCVGTGFTNTAKRAG